MANEKIELVFDLEKETKNTFRYAERERDGKPKVVGTIYLQKYLAKALGKEILVTIKEVVK